MALNLQLMHSFHKPVLHPQARVNQLTARPLSRSTPQFAKMGGAFSRKTVKAAGSTAGVQKTCTDEGVAQLKALRVDLVCYCCSGTSLHGYLLVVCSCALHLVPAPCR